jgi:hypothetical protein
MELASGRIASETLLRAAAANGARAVRFEDSLGSLTPGKDADLLVVRRDRVFFPPERYSISNPLDVIVDRTDQTDLSSVMVRGRLVLDEGRITGVDEDRIRRAYADAAANRMWRFASEQEKRWALDLPAQIEPYVLEFYERWTSRPVAPGYAYNTTTGPAGTNGRRKEEVPRWQQSPSS